MEYFENEILTSTKKAIPRKNISDDHFIVEKNKFMRENIFY